MNQYTRGSCCPVRRWGVPAWSRVPGRATVALGSGLVLTGPGLVRAVGCPGSTDACPARWSARSSSDLIVRGACTILPAMQPGLVSFFSVHGEVSPLVAAVKALKAVKGKALTGSADPASA